MSIELRYINQEMYQDVVEERAITKLCGYSICGKKIPEMPKKQYYISTKLNKVYELSERKNYCSNFCYKASQHLKDQIETSPLWLRNFAESPDFQLLPATERGSPGEVINQGIAEPVIESTFTSISSFAQLSLNEVERLEIKGHEKNGNHSVIKQEPTTSKAVTKHKFKQATKNPNMSIINEEFANGEEDEVKFLDEVEADYKIGTQVRIKREEETPNEVQQSAETKIASADRIETTDGVVASSNSKTKKGKPTLEEIIAKHKQKQMEKKGVKVIELAEIISKKASGEQNSKGWNPKGNSIEVRENPNEIKENPEGIKENSEETKGNAKEMKENTKEIRDPPKENKVGNRIKECLKQWLTIETYIFLHGETRVKEILTERKLAEYFEKLRITDLETVQQLKYMQICKRLHLQELAEEKFDKSVIGSKLQPLPDYKKLKEDGRELNLKVKSFYCGVLYEKEDSNFPMKPSKKDEEDAGSSVVLPMVDSSSQVALRRKVFMNSISKMVQSHVHEMEMDASYVTSEVQNLVRTFRLSPKNIIFKPAVWNMVAMLLIKILSFRDSTLKEHLEKDRAAKRIDSLFCILPNHGDFLSEIDGLIGNVEDFIESFIISESE